MVIALRTPKTEIPSTVLEAELVGICVDEGDPLEVLLAPVVSLSTKLK